MKRNRTYGHNFEREICKELKPIFFNIKTSRYGSKEMDDKGVDLINTSPYAFQLKAGIQTPNFEKIFDNMDTDEIKVIVWKKRNKGRYVILEWERFLEII